MSIKASIGSWRTFSGSSWASVAAIVALGCSDGSSPASPPHGPPGGIIDVDAGAIPLGDSGSGGAASGGSAGQGTSAVGGTQSGGGGRSGTQSGGSGGSGTPTARSIGAPCDIDSDCNSPLVCHFDATDYIVHRQCTTPCDSDAACTGTGNHDSHCIGANLCVRNCQTDLDCAPKTHCNDFGWCERSGPGSGNPYCAGAPTACALLSDATCGFTDGCLDNSKCSGIADGCYVQFSSYSCISQQGCYWSSSSSSCSGAAESCNLMSGSYSCVSQQGCFWSGGCTGVAQPCSQQLISDCSIQPGCSLTTDP